MNQILVRMVVLGVSAVDLVACGQQGALYLPNTPAEQRATLPQSLLPQAGAVATPPAASATPAASQTTKQ